MRACWTAPAPALEASDRPLAAVGPGRRHGQEALVGTGAGRRPRTFVPVEMLQADAEAASGGSPTELAVASAAPIAPATGAAGRIPGTWWLWGDPEPWPES
jgi:hypothetical protein